VQLLAASPLAATAGPNWRQMQALQVQSQPGATSIRRDPMLGGNEMAGLHAFLRSRCGSLKAAFNELDSHGVGQLTSDDFVKGLERLGYTEDAGAMFRSIDVSKTGLVTLKSFMNCLGDRVVEAIEAERQSSKTLSRSSSEDVWKSARIPTPKNSPPSLLTSNAVGNALKSGSALRSSTPDMVPGAVAPPSPHMPVAGADLLYARIARVEEQVAAEQRLRCETEQRLTQHLNSLVGVSISEQLDVLRQQLIEERCQRQVDVTSLRAALEAVRTSGVQPGDLQECVKSELDRSIGDIRSSLEQTCPVSPASSESELKKRLEDSHRATEQRFEALESAMKEATAAVAKAEPAEQLQNLLQQTRYLEERVDSMSSNVDLLTSTVETQARQAMELREDLLASLTSGEDKGSNGTDGTTFEKIQDFVREKMDRLRVEWNGAMEEERTRTMERSQALSRALTEEFERSIVAQAVAEARTEARSAVAAEGHRASDAVQQAVRQLSQDLEALRKGLAQRGPEGPSGVDVAKLAEKICEEKIEKLAISEHTMKTQAEALELLQNKVQLWEESLRTKLQALINKVDSKCLEGFVPILSELGSALGNKPKVLSVDRTQDSSWCNHSNSSGNSDSQSARSPQAPSRCDPKSKVVAPQVQRQSSASRLEESQQIEALLQENLLLKEAQVRLREENVEMRERAHRMQDAAHQMHPVPAPAQFNRSARSHSPPIQPKASASPPPPTGPQAPRPRTSLPPNGAAQPGLSRPVSMTGPVMSRTMEQRAPCPGTPVVDGRQARVVAPALPMQRVRTPSPAVTGMIAGRMHAHDGTAPSNGSASLKPCTGR